MSRLRLRTHNTAFRHPIGDPRHRSLGSSGGERHPPGHEPQGDAAAQIALQHGLEQRDRCLSPAPLYGRAPRDQLMASACKEDSARAAIQSTQHEPPEESTSPQRGQAPDAGKPADSGAIAGAGGTISPGPVSGHRHQGQRARPSSRDHGTWGRSWAHLTPSA